MGKKLIANDFIEHSIIKHGEKYNYSKCKYVNSTTSVIIICSVHGKFSQRPKNHMRGDGCNKCGEDRAAKKRKGSTEEFVHRAKKVHGNRYDYSQSEYKFAKEKLIIICREHGPWRQEASSHILGNGCPACGGRKQLTTDEFIKRSQEIHGNKFDYSKSKYRNSKTNITIICPEHGQFQQKSNPHFNGTGCPECAKVQRGLSKRSNTEDFIHRALEVHGDKYDYSKSEYERGHDKITIVCPEHGDFYQEPANHLSGNGCKLCGLKKAGQYHKKDTNSFIKEARKVHGNKYDYAQAKYMGAREHITIVCAIHGAFEQTASTHLGGYGCGPCSYEIRGQNQRMTFEEFVKLANGVHGNRYDYSPAKGAFRSANDKINFICPDHGIVTQLPANHLSSTGCPKCGDLLTSEKLQKTTASFIEGARRVHGDKFDYSKANYVGAFEQIVIICPIDGEFSQSPTSHLGGTGCPKCSRRGQGAPRNLVRALRGEFDAEKTSFVYSIQFKFPYSDGLLFKVGSGSGSRVKTTRNSIRKVGGTGIEIWQKEFQTTGEAIVFEHLAHEQVCDYQYIVLPEFKFPGYSEVFSKKPNFAAVDVNPTLERFRSGDRWDPRD